MFQDTQVEVVLSRVKLIVPVAEPPQTDGQWMKWTKHKMSSYGNKGIRDWISLWGQRRKSEGQEVSR